MTTPSVDDLNGMLPDRYTVKELIDRGDLDFGYRAMDHVRDQPVTIHVLRPELSFRDARTAFLRRAKFLSQLDHVGIVRLLNSGEEKGVFYRVTEYLEGETLRDRLAREGQQPLEYAIRVIHEVADSLIHAHERGIVLWRITPASITLTSERAVMTDVSGAFALEEGDPRDPEVFIGNPTYVSPETLNNEIEIDSRTDIYSLGMMLYEMLAAEPPFLGRTSTDIVRMVLEQQPPPLDAHRPAVHHGVQDVVDKALAKRPADRYQTVREFSDALDDLIKPHAPGPGLWRMWRYLKRFLHPFES